MTGQGFSKSENALYSCHNREHAFGIGFITKRLKQAVIDFKAVNHRICNIRIREKFFNYSIIKAHAPTEDKPYCYVNLSNNILINVMI